MSARAEVLFLAHRIPYPPDKGDKIRSWRLFSHLAERYDVHLGCFIDDPDDARHCAFLEERCRSAFFANLSPFQAKIRSARGFLTGDPLCLAYYNDGAMSRWVEKVQARDLAAEIVFSSVMAPYVEKSVAGRPQLVDLCDADSAKWAAYAEGRRGPMAAIYAREARKLALVEARIIDRVDAAFAISASEARLLGAGAGRDVLWYGNGVDTAYFSPLSDSQPRRPVADVVFVGMMDYWANVDAVLWFMRDVWPMVRAANHDATFAIVGARPDDRIAALDGVSGIKVTGRVDDVRPWVRGAGLVVAPMRIARGVQNKILEAMACGKVVVTTGQGAEGLDAARGELIVAENAKAFGAAIVQYLGDREKAAALGQKARARMVRDYTWSAQLARFEAVARPLIEQGHASVVA